MTLRNLPPSEKPREKLLKKGSDYLTDSELIAILLGYGNVNHRALEVARNLLLKFGGVRGICDASYNRLTEENGLGLASYCRLQAILELGRRYLFETISRGDAFENPTVTRRFLESRLRHQHHEVFGVLFLDNAHRVIAFEELFHGTINGASVYPRVVLQRALAHNSAAVIFAHNHPSGIAEPSQADRQITETLISVLTIVDVRVLDHFVIGEEEAISFAERGLI